MKLDPALLLSFALGASASLSAAPCLSDARVPAPTRDLAADASVPKEPVAGVQATDGPDPAAPRPITPDYCPPCGMG